MKRTPKANFETINYNLRPAKNAERKMLCEAFYRLSVLDNLKNYLYIGFGSAYFTDFTLFHRNLGLDKLISIEKESEDEYKRRIEFNSPYECVKLLFGDSNKVLPTIEWNKIKRSIVWLDYTGRLDSSMLGDINTVIRQVKPGSIFLISVNIDPDKKTDVRLSDEERKQFRLEKLKARIEEDDIPDSVNGIDLDIDNNKQIIREIVDNTIGKAIRIRNGGESTTNQLLYSQLFNFYYKDGAPMQTIGGIVYNKRQDYVVQNMFSGLDFIKRDDSCFDINIPHLTIREINTLNKVLPNTSTKDIKKIIPISEDAIESYKKIYRYFPNFNEVFI